MRRPIKRKRKNTRQESINYGALEDRIVLATFIVNTTADTGSGATDGFVSLREAVVAANTNTAFGDAIAGDADGDVIRFDPSIYNSTISLTLGQLSVSDDVFIQGGVSNITIAGNGNTRLFEVTATERVGFGKLTFSNGNAVIGGAMSIIGSGTTLLFETTFTNNEATGDGGGAVFYANGNMFVTDSTFTNNDARGTSGSGGAIYLASGNIYANGGAMVGNTVNRAGGAIEAIGGTFFGVNLDVGSLSAGNVAGPLGSANPGNGGGLHVAGTARVTLQGGQVVGNYAANEGGGMWVGGNGLLFVRPGTDVINNSAAGALVGSGGGIYNDGAKLYVNQANISSNSASGAAGGGGGIFADGGSTVLNQATVDSNTSRRTGGGIHVDAGFLQLTNSDVTNNEVGVIFVTPDATGGGIYAKGASSVVINDGQVANNTTTLRGGGIWADTNSLLFLRNGASVSFNVLTDANSIGGGIYTAGYTQVIGSFVQRNESEASGGGMYLNPTATARIDASTFFENDGGVRGGGFFNNNSVYVTNSTFTGNSVTTDGGAYFTSASGNTIAQGINFTSNTPNNFN